MLHIHCCDSSADSLRASGIAGKIITWYDPLLEGATPEGVSSREWLRLRAANLQSFFPDETAATQAIVEMEQRLQQYIDFSEVVLWFDACLFDQLILIRQLDWFAHTDFPPQCLSLICIGEFPGHAIFHGLSELSSSELASLLITRHQVTAAETTLACKAWAAYRAPSPAAIEKILGENTDALPYLRSALLQHLARFPSTVNGLNRLEQAALTAISTGHQSLWEIMQFASKEIVPAYFGDSYLFSLLEYLCSGARPLLRESGLAEFRQQARYRWPIAQAKYALTDAGEAILQGNADWILLHEGIDHWLGGVHLQGSDSLWRWDEKAGKIVCWA